MDMDIREFQFMKVKGKGSSISSHQATISNEHEFCFVRRENIIGLVNARDFALPDTDSGKFTVRNIMSFCKHRYGTAITPNDSSYDVFNLFKKGFSDEAKMTFSSMI